MASFLHLQRQIGLETMWVSINVDHIAAYYPAIDIDHYGKVEPRNGTHIWTTMERGESSYPWHVIEDYQMVTAMIDAFVNGAPT